MKKLIPGSRVLIEATNEIYDNMYVGKYIKTIVCIYLVEIIGKNKKIKLITLIIDRII